MADRTTREERQAERNEIRRECLAQAEKTAAQRGRSLKCGPDPLYPGRKHAGEPDGCANDGSGCICECHDPAPCWSGPDPGTDRVLLVDAVRYVLKGQFAAQTAIQRNVRVGFAKAGRLLDLMEGWGLVGPKEGSAARKVLVAAEHVDQVVAAINATADNTQEVPRG